MPIRDKPTLKAYFNTGDKPTESNFADLIDSLVITETDPVFLASEAANLVVGDAAKLAAIQSGADMLKSVYDPYDQGVVDKAKQIDRQVFVEEAGIPNPLQPLGHFFTQGGAAGLNPDGWVGIETDLDNKNAVMHMAASAYGLNGLASIEFTTEDDQTLNPTENSLLVLNKDGLALTTDLVTGKILVNGGKVLTELDNKIFGCKLFYYLDYPDTLIIAPAIATAIPWNQEDFDSNAFHDGVSPNIIIPAGMGGMYLIVANIFITDPSAVSNASIKSHGLYIDINGQPQGKSTIVCGGGDYGYGNISVVVNLVPGDSIVVEVHNNNVDLSGENIEVNNSSFPGNPARYCWVSVTRMGNL